jgi:hypothetical protein
MNSTREYWLSIAYKLCFPVLDALSQRRLKSEFMDKKPTAHLEAFCRVLVGIASWIELNDGDYRAEELKKLILLSINSLTDPSSDDYIDFSIKEQVLVEAAILCLALNKGYNSIWCSLSQDVQKQVVLSLKKTRKFIAHDNNWVLFPSMIESFFMKIGQDVDYNRLRDGIKQYTEWYQGDGVYGDGVELHMDYYNSYIIYPMLYEVLSILNDCNDNTIKFTNLYGKHKKRLQRWAVLQERMIAVDGTFPPIGRSITYRCAAFHGLALNVLIDDLDNSLSYGQVRVALTKVIKATLEHPGTFENKWLTIGLYGKQPNLAESYINHGSLYLCSTIFLPLGLPPTSMFWTDEDRMTTWEKVVNGIDIKRDKPYIECVRKIGHCV